VTGVVTTTKGTTKTTTAVKGTIVSWNDGMIVAKFGSLPSAVTVRSVFGSATSKVPAP
jgi:hypothetical protein